MLHGLMLTSSLNHKKPAKGSRQAVVNLRSAKYRLFFASSTISSNMARIIGAFFTAGLASSRCIPSSIVLTNGEVMGVTKPAVEWTQAIALQASSTADFDCDFSPSDWM